MAREMDVAMHGDKAARCPMLCDVTASVVGYFTASRPQAEGLALSALVTEEVIEAFCVAGAETEGQKWPEDFSDGELIHTRHAVRKALEAALPLLLAAVRKNL